MTWLTQPSVGDTGWGSDVNTNFSLLESALKSGGVSIGPLDLGSTNITNAADVAATSFTAGGYSLDSTEFGNLDGLNQSLGTGSTPAFAGLTLSGDLNMGANAITNVGNVDGVDVSNHASRHAHGGDDAVTLTKDDIADLEDITTTPTEDAIPKANDSGKIASGWLDTSTLVELQTVSNVSSVTFSGLDGSVEIGYRLVLYGKLYVSSAANKYLFLEVNGDTTASNYRTQGFIAYQGSSAGHTNFFVYTKAGIVIAYTNWSLTGDHWINAEMDIYGWESGDYSVARGQSHIAHDGATYFSHMMYDTGGCHEKSNDGEITGLAVKMESGMTFTGKAYLYARST